MAGFRLKFEGGERIAEAFRKAANRCLHAKALWKAVGQIALTSMEKNFDAQGRPQKWAPLAPATIRDRLKGRVIVGRRSARRTRVGVLKKVRGMRILQRSGHLKQSIVAHPDAEGVDVGSIGSNLIYARIQQLGGEAGRKSNRVTLPARSYVMLQDEDVEEIRATVVDWVMGPLNGSSVD